jgi:hypothetical protein
MKDSKKASDLHDFEAFFCPEGCYILRDDYWILCIGGPLFYILLTAAIFCQLLTNDTAFRSQYVGGPCGQGPNLVTVIDPLRTVPVSTYDLPHF